MHVAQPESNNLAIRYKAIALHQDHQFYKQVICTVTVKYFQQHAHTSLDVYHSISSRPVGYVMGCILSASREQKSYFKYISHASAFSATQRCCLYYSIKVKLLQQSKNIRQTHSSNKIGRAH